MFQSTEILLSPCFFFFFFVRYCPLLSVTVRYYPLLGPKHPQYAPNIPKYAPETTYVHCYQSHVAPIWPRNRSKPLKTTLQHCMAHMAYFGPFRTSNMAVTRPSGGQTTLNMPQTYPNMLQIPPMCIATSHMCHPQGLKIA
jgi:hypothetical protein